MDGEQDRDVLGAVRVGGPLMEVYQTVTRLARRLPFPVRQAAVACYGDHMLLVWLPRLIDASLPTRDLARLDPRTVKRVALLLYRDMFRHHARYLAPRGHPGWIDALFARVAADHGVALPPATRFEIDDPTRRAWAKELGAEVGVRGFKLFACHGSLVATVIEECNVCTPDPIDARMRRS